MQLGEAVHEILQHVRSISGSLTALTQRVAALEKDSQRLAICPDCFVSVAPGHVCKTPYREWCSACNEAHAPEAHTIDADPPAAPTLDRLREDLEATIRVALGAQYTTPEHMDKVAAGMTEDFLREHVIDRRTPADARLRALAEAVVQRFYHMRAAGDGESMEALDAYLRETAR